jgi:dihydroneopterin aldolase
VRAFRITLRAMRFHVRVGVLPHEREHAQPLEVDLTVERQASAELLDYRALYALVQDVLRAEPHGYLEEIAESLAARALLQPAVARVWVAVRKPHVMLDGPLEYAEVSLERAAGG